ncbi:MAG TPA: hypothetical protein VFW66_12940 [Gemmatimonadales bacterium]|nr:hypothetical protein [Gemmatimonadales bacterium]
MARPTSWRSRTRRHRINRVNLLILATTLACGGPEHATPAARTVAESNPAAPASGASTPAADSGGPADSLVLRAPHGVEVWATFARSARDSAGAACVERALEIRDGARRTPVPLLYTRDTPRLLNDSTFTVQLSNACRPGAGYAVNLRTGQPVPTGR